jgi:hypothetical protein
VNTYAARDLVEEYIAAKVFPVRAGWSDLAWNDFASSIKIPEFARSFGLTKNGMHLLFLRCFLLHLDYFFIFIFFFFTNTCLYPSLQQLPLLRLKLG